MFDKNVLLSVVIPVRDKPQFSQVIDSLTLQRVKGDFELVVVDYGSTKQNVLQELTAFSNRFTYMHSVRLLRLFHIPQFNRSRALNIGFRWSLGQYIFTLDADVILPPKYLSALVRKVGPTSCVRCEGKESSNMQYRKWCGSGIMAIPFHGVFKVTGYDESFVGYGEEDIDFRDRLKQAGYGIGGIRDPAWVHLSHGNAERGQAQYCSRLRGAVNPNKVKRLRNAKLRIVATNPYYWGTGLPFELQHFELK
jgi:glycosyltransferase involved in cell wall biosynthesis